MGLRRLWLLLRLAHGSPLLWTAHRTPLLRMLRMLRIPLPRRLPRQLPRIRLEWLLHRLNRLWHRPLRLLGLYRLCPIRSRLWLWLRWNRLWLLWGWCWGLWG